MIAADNSCKRAIFVAVLLYRYPIKAPYTEEEAINNPIAGIIPTVTTTILAAKAQPDMHKNIIVLAILERKLLVFPLNNIRYRPLIP